jgi:hypothetical protein
LLQRKGDLIETIVSWSHHFFYYFDKIFRNTEFIR